MEERDRDEYIYVKISWVLILTVITKLYENFKQNQLFEKY